MNCGAARAGWAGATGNPGRPDGGSARRMRTWLAETRSSEVEEAEKGLTMAEWRQEIRRRLAGLMLAPTREVAIVEELAQYLEDHYAELLASGMTEAEAYRQTLTELSGSELLAHELQRAERQVAPDPIAPGTNRRTNMIADLWQDLRYGARMLLRSPIFTGVATLTLALGMGVNTAIFTLFYSLAWRPLPVKDPASVVNIWQTISGDDYGRRLEGNPSQISYPEYINYRDQTRSFAGLAAYAEEKLTLTGGDAERINAQVVTDNYFAVLGGEAALGRTFVPNECQTPGACSQVVLSHTFWQRRFSSDPNVIGKTLILNRRPFTVVGVTARSWSSMGIVAGPLFDLPLIAPDIWGPLM